MKVPTSLPMNHSAPCIRIPSKGFTLVEILITLSVIVILMSIFFGIQRGVYSAQAQTKAKAELAVIASALETFKSRYGDYPWKTPDVADENFLLRVLTGQLYLGRDEDTGEVRMLAGNRRSLTDVAALTVQPPNQATGKVVDPWGSDYQYFYRIDEDHSGWQNPGFILLSAGENRKITPGTLTTSGIVASDFFQQPNNHDVIIYGYNN